MLKLRDFFHLPELDGHYKQICRGETGLTLVAGLDAHTTAAPAEGSLLLPSGRSTIFDILASDILESHLDWQGLVLPAPKSSGSAARSGMARPPRHLKRRVRELQGDPSGPVYPELFAGSKTRQPTLLMVERLTGENTPAVLAAARQMPVLAQLDTALAGGGAARQLLDLGIQAEELDCLNWVLCVQRLPTLCTHCSQPATPTQEQYARLCSLYPHLEALAGQLLLEPESAQAKEALHGKKPAFARASGCEHCHQSGRLGDVAAFDIFKPQGLGPAAIEGLSLLSQEEYLLRLAALGRLSLDDLLYLEQSRLQRTYSVLTAQEKALGEANASIYRKLAELEAANRVLLQRTEVLVSLQDLSQTLIASSDLQDLANKVCRRAAELCAADRVIVYIFTNGSNGQDLADMLAVNGWPNYRLKQHLEAGLVHQINPGREPAAYNHLPPGVSAFNPGERENAEPDKILAGLSVPLLAEEQRVGLMIVQTTRKARFIPSEVALLQTFANQAALAMQRAGLVEELRAKIVQLEAAQVELFKKERLEHELELARQVQQSMLPDSFPEFPGFNFAAKNRPARTVGGDFYDAFALEAGRFGLFIGDVSDKGMPAALYMTLTRSLLRAEARREASPAQVLANVNRLLLELGESKQFVSVFYGVVDPAALTLTYARAGHDYPLLLREARLQILGGEGMVLGIMDEDELLLAEETTQLQKGDRLVLYTDGLTDVVDADGRFFDLARLEAIITSNPGLTLEALCQAIFTELDAYQGEAEQFDDMTLLIMSVG